SLFTSPKRTASASIPSCCFKSAYTIAEQIVSVSGLLWPITCILPIQTLPISYNISITKRTIFHLVSSCILLLSSAINKGTAYFLIMSKILCKYVSSRIHFPFSRCCSAAFGSALRLLSEAFHPAGVSLHSLRLIFYTLCWALPIFLFLNPLLYVIFL